MTSKNPVGRIVHLQDWHFVPKDLYAIDMKNAHGRGLTDDEIDRLYQEHLLEVELVQVEQMAVLRCLIKHHGLKKVFLDDSHQPTWRPSGRRSLCYGRCRKMRVDQQNNELRQDAQVKAMMKEGPAAAIVLCGAHDLTESTKRIGGGLFEYLRVATKRFKVIGG